MSKVKKVKQNIWDRFKNWKTTFFGFLCAVGVTVYDQLNGQDITTLETKTMWKAVGLAVFFALLRDNWLDKLFGEKKP